MDLLRVRSLLPTPDLREILLRSCAKCSVFVAFQFTTYETIYLFVILQLAGLYSAGNDDAESFPKALGTLLGSAGV